MLPKCHRLVDITQTSIDKGIFPDGPDVRQVLDAIMTEAHVTLMYRRQCRMTWGIDGQGGRAGR